MLLRAMLASFSCTLLLLVRISSVASHSYNAQSPFVDPPDQSLNADFEYHCFDRSFASRLFPATHQDCLNAAQEILLQDEDSLRIFARTGSNNVFKLPWVARNGTCTISLDVVDDKDRDTFTPGIAFAAAVKLTSECTNGDNEIDNCGLGGKSYLGPRKLVTLTVLGMRSSHLEGDEKIAETISNISNSRTNVTGEGYQNRSYSENASHLDRRRIVRPSPISRSARDLGEDLMSSMMLDKQNVSASIVNDSTNNVPGEGRSHLSNTTIMDSGGPPAPHTLSVGGVPECYDPPTPRERLYPVEFLDCEKATVQIVGGRNKEFYYIFTRKLIRDRFYYPLPKKYTYGSCVVYLDMVNDSVQDKVKLRFVEASAYVLAHKCSGQEKAPFKYGGSMTVGVGANNLIRVYVYGTWPQDLNEKLGLSSSWTQYR